MGGDFILRIEDTDPERSTEENVAGHLERHEVARARLGRGPRGGRCRPAPYFQTQRTDTYAAALERLQRARERLPLLLHEGGAGRQARRRPRRPRAATRATTAPAATSTPPRRPRAYEAGEPHVWRLRVPRGPRPHRVRRRGVRPRELPGRRDGRHDRRAHRRKPHLQLRRGVRRREHGHHARASAATTTCPTRPRQILIYEALGFDVPMFAHLSMILGPDGKSFSKRHGAASVEEFCERGYLPDAMVNFLALLGWSLDGETTLIDRETLCEKSQPRARDQEGRRLRRDEARLDERPVYQGYGRERVGALVAAVARTGEHPRQRRGRRHAHRPRGARGRLRRRGHRVRARRRAGARRSGTATCTRSCPSA